MQGRLGAGKLVALIVVAGALLAPQAASADITSVFGGDVGCTTESDGVRFCDLGSDPARSTVPAWDGVPIDVRVAFPPAPASGPGRALSADHAVPRLRRRRSSRLADMQPFLDRGYATFA